MAFLRSTIFLRHIFKVVQRHTFYLTNRPVHRSNALFNTNNKQYAMVMAQQLLPLGKRLDIMEKSYRNGQFVTKEDVNQLLQALREGKPSSDSYLRAFKFFGKCMSEETVTTRSQLARQLWQIVENQSVVKISHYNALLSVNVENEQTFSVVETLKDIKSRDLKPDHFTFQRIIENYSSTGNLDSVNKTLAIMEEEGIGLNNYIYNAIILAHGMGGQRETALNLLETMKSKGFQPQLKTYLNVLRIHAKYGDVSTILTEIERLKYMQMALQDIDILQLIYDLALNGHGTKCDQLFGLLSKKGHYIRLATNTINRLIQNNQDDVAYELLNTFPKRQTAPGESINNGVGLLKQLMKANRPITTLTAMCQRLQDDGLHSTPYSVIFPKSDASPDQVWAMLRERKANSMPLFEENFRSLFDSTKESEVVQALRTMIQEFKIYPSIKFLRAVVMPKINVKKPDTAINILLSTSILPTQAALAVSYRCLQKNQLKDAADICNYFKLHVWIGLYQSVLSSALNATNDVTGYVKFLRVYYEYFSRTSNDTTTNENASSEKSNELDRSDALGSIIFNTLLNLDSNNGITTPAAILKELVNEGLTISQTQADRIENEIGARITSGISNYLNQLASGELHLKPLQKPKYQIFTSSFQLEKKISENRTKNKVFNQIELLDAYHREGNMEKFEKLFEDLEKQGISIPPTMYNHLIERQLKLNNFSKATEIFDKYKARNPKFFLFTETIVEAVSVFIRNEQFDEAIEFLTKIKGPVELQQVENASQPWFFVLNHLADDGKEIEVNQLFDTLLDNRYIIATNKLLDPLVKVHVVNGDSRKAIKAFEDLANKFKMTPFKGGLFTHLVTAEDWDGLQETVRISSTVHGDHNTLIDLAFTYIECGQRERARQLFTLPTVVVDQYKINNIAKKYKKKKAVQYLEDLMNVSQNLFKFNRELIFLNLLELYISEGKTTKAIELNVKLQEQEEIPSRHFLNTLGTYLKSKNIDVTFEIPEEIKQIPGTKGSFHTQKSYTDSVKSPLNKSPISKKLSIDKLIMQKISERNPEEIRKLFKRLSEANLIDVINKITKQENYMKSIYTLFAALADDGNIIALTQVNSLLPEIDKDGPWFRNNYAKACGVSGQTDQWFSEWNNKLLQADTVKDLQILDNTFPVEGFYHVFENNPNLFGQCEALANKYAERNVTSPMGAIWCHHIINKNKTISQNIWNQSIQNREEIFIQPIISKAYRDSSAVILIELIETLRSSKTGAENLNAIYSTLLEMYVRKNQFDEALKYAELLKACNGKFMRRTLVQLKNGLEAEGKHFPYDIIKKGSQTCLRIQS